MITEDEYKKILYTLLPPGDLYPEQAGQAPVWDSWINALAQELVRFETHVDTILLEAIPDALNYAYPSDYLEKWEEILGLPDTCVFTTQTSTERVQAIIAKLRGAGSPTAQKFLNIIDLGGYNARVLDNYKVIDTIDRDGSGEVDWTLVNNATVTNDVAEDKDGNVEADRVYLPAVTVDRIQADILNIADYEKIFVSFDIKGINPVAAGLTVRLVGRDNIVKHSDLDLDFSSDNNYMSSWHRYSFTVDDVGSGVIDPYLEIRMNAGSEFYFYVANIRAGYKELFHEHFRAGAVAGVPALGENAELLFTCEYGSDWTSRNVGGSPDWTAQTSATINDDSENDPITREQLADDITVTAGTYFYCEFIGFPAPPQYINYNFWIKSDNEIDVDLYFSDKTGSALLQDTLHTDDGWQNVQGTVDLSTGGSTPYIRFDPPLNEKVYISNLRMSKQDRELECRINSGKPLHTNVLFGAYEVLGGKPCTG